MPSVSPAGLAPKGTVTRFGCSLLPGSFFTHQPPCLPSLHRFVLPGFIATMKALTSSPAGPRTSDGPLGGAGSVRTTSLGLTGRISLLISFELPTIPSPATALPFHHDRFDTLHHRRGCPRLSPGQTQRVEGIAVTWTGFDICEQSPRQAWPNRVRVPTDWSFTSGCSPPFLRETQLPLLVTGS
jgi:hypothetical protein